MQYCERCHMLSEGRCTKCGGRLRDPRPNDPMLLMRGDTIHTAIVASLMEAEKIPFSKVGRMGAALAMQTGGMMEEFSVFVPYGAWEVAKALIAVETADVSPSEEALDEDAPAEEDALFPGLPEEEIWEEQEREEEEDEEAGGWAR